MQEGCGGGTAPDREGTVAGSRQPGACAHALSGTAWRRRGAATPCGSPRRGRLCRTIDSVLGLGRPGVHGQPGAGFSACGIARGVGGAGRGHVVTQGFCNMTLPYRVFGAGGRVDSSGIVCMRMQKSVTKRCCKIIKPVTGWSPSGADTLAPASSGDAVREQKPVLEGYHNDHWLQC